MPNVFDFRTKLYIVLGAIYFPNFFYNLYIWLILGQASFFLELNRPLPLLFVSLSSVILALYFLIFKTGKTRLIGWVFVTVPSLIALFNPFPQLFAPDIPKGSLLQIFQLITTGSSDTISFFLAFSYSWIPLLTLVIAATKILDYSNKNFDRYIFFVFIGFLVLSDLITGLVVGFRFVSISISTFVYGFIVLAAVLFWDYLEKKKAAAVKS